MRVAMGAIFLVIGSLFLAMAAWIVWSVANDSFIMELEGDPVLYRRFVFPGVYLSMRAIILWAACCLIVGAGAVVFGCKVIGSSRG